TEVCARHFGDRVKHWMVMNEPSVFTGAGYFLGVHAPGKTGLSNYLKAVHHATLATAASGRALRTILPQANIGTTFSCTHVEPASQSPRDMAAAKRADALLNRTFLEPLLGLGYPQADIPILRKMDRYRLANDDRHLPFDFDFIGLQCYTREVVKASYFTPYIHASLVKAEKRKVPTTEMKWEVYPPSIYEVIKKFNAYPNIPRIIMTENGAAFPDQLVDGQINDVQRRRYIQDHLRQVLRAKEEGYHTRFGLIHINYETQQRIVKQSGLWYGRFLAGDC
ncbi:MAG: glycosyl hydrolase family protein, partial [Sphingobacteriales bacterium]